MIQTTSTAAHNLMQRIQTKQARAGIIGLGYVGLPLAVEFAKAGVETVGIDIDASKIRSLEKGESYIQDVAQDELQAVMRHKKFRATSDFSVIRDLDTINICVPTPLRKSKDPDISYIVSATEEIVKYLHPGMLVILESTTYPGTTQEVIQPMLEKTGLKVGREIHLAFSPERVDPGNPKYQTRNIPKVVGGVTENCTNLAAAFYGLAIERVHKVSSPAAAEMVKLLENTFRSVNIGLVNELCQMSEKLGVNVWEIIDAAATKPFGFMPFYPGPGLGGHCIPIDPHYLAWKARIHGFAPRFIELASEINAQMPEFVVRKVLSILNERGKALQGSKIHLLGMTYKKNVSDMRESPSFEVLHLLESYGAQVSYSDPFVSDFSLGGRSYKSADHTKGEFLVDLAILLTDHDCFDREKILAAFPLILDTRNFFRGKQSEQVIRI